VDAAHLGAVRLIVAALAPFARGVVVQWVLPPVWLTRWLTRVNRRVVYDLDDAVYLAHPRRAEALARAAWRVVVGSHDLERFAGAAQRRDRADPERGPGGGLPGETSG
jgi:hypothetical protein